MAVPDTGCEVTFTGSHGGTYTIPCDRINDIRDDMVNIGNSTIYLYPSGQALTDSSYPYISIERGHYPRYYSSNYQQYDYITNAANVRFNFLGNYYREKVFITPMLELLLAFCLIVRLFKK